MTVNVRALHCASAGALSSLVWLEVWARGSAAASGSAVQGGADRSCRPIAEIADLRQDVD